ncbi:LysR family transcriptional regulator [Actinomadura decatromicini]|uniref:LysR family transcriptional regulator n=1 Tax=Actinomadura decatromicini TaxID=2604572 RepID=A0A5D3FSX7_9ACTN|nr:LysR family transcriptional regulator [Actinomadura decatromicini]TYK51122.1 LysR family transcriptional regulator [Actinomadura decatromicini]
MDLSLLRTFLAVYRAGSLTAAAGLVGLSQPTVTAQLRALEAELGSQLFQRLPRGVAPTTVADELAAEVASHIDALAAVAERGLVARDPFTKPLHLAGPAELTTMRVLPALAPLVDQGLRLRISLGLSDELLAGLAAGRFDLVISTVRPRGRAVVAAPLTDEEFVLVAGRSWAARIDRERLAGEGAGCLRGVPLVSYAEDLPVIRRYWRTLFGTRPTGSATVVVPDLRGVLAAVVAGSGISVLPRYLCTEELASGALVALLDPEIPPINTLYVAARAGTEHAPHIAAVRSRLLMQARLW